MNRRNPFTPSFGKMPLHLAGRRELLDAMNRAFENGSGDPNLSSVLIGPRGTGKTALLARIAENARQRGWVAAGTTAIPGMLEDILQRARSDASHIVTPDRETRIKGLSLGQLVGIEVDYPDSEPRNWRSRMTELLDELGDADVGLLITVDEVRADVDEMIQLAAMYQHFVQEDRKVALVMAGLPYHISALVRDESVSFLRRSRHHQLDRISDPDVENAMRQTIEDAGGRIADAALSEAVAAVEGFAYMLQLVGYWTWERSRDGSIGFEEVRGGVDLARRDMRGSVLDSTYRELSEGDIRFLSAMTSIGEEATLADVSKALGVKSNYSSKYKKRLLEQGIISDAGRNHLRIDLPGFADYLREKTE